MQTDNKCQSKVNNVLRRHRIILIFSNNKAQRRATHFDDKHPLVIYLEDNSNMIFYVQKSFCN